MKEVTYKCDACGRSALTIRMKLPIKVYREYSAHLDTKKMDICRECAKRISDEYYKICKEHNSSGIVGVI